MIRPLLTLIMALGGASHGHGEDPPLSIASEARIFLRHGAGGGPLLNPELGPGLVTGATVEQRIEDGKWLTEIRFPVQWWRWSAVEFGFASPCDGELEVMLAGPWAATRDGTEIRQEIHWDDIRCEGAHLKNGGFENAGPAAWESPYAPYPDPMQWPLANAPALAGKSSATTWHGRPLTQTIRLSQGADIRLLFHARAATPPDFQAPRNPGDDTPAHQACKRLRRGVNLGNCWESPPGEAAVEFTPADIDRIADCGFDHIRVPVAWHHWIDSNGISRELLAKLDPVLRHAMRRGLIAMPVWQNHPQLMANPASHREAFLAGWKAISEHYQSWPPQLFFNLLNEPSGELAGNTLNALYSATIRIIREKNPERILVVEPDTWSTVGGLDRLHPPDGDPRIIVSIHCYDPFPITHQGASWVGLEALGGLRFPGPPPTPAILPRSLRDRPGMISWTAAYNRQPAASNPGGPAAFEALLSRAAEWSRRFGRPLHIGEFGATRAMDSASRTAYAEAFTRAASRHSLPCCWWEWKAGFGCWDPENGIPLLVKPLTDR